jgi:hypothetical protein
MTTTLTNSFHNTKIKVRLPFEVEEYESQSDLLNRLFQISENHNDFFGATKEARNAYNQYKRIKNKLCGMDNCSCGVVR